MDRWEAGITRNQERLSSPLIPPPERKLRKFAGQVEIDMAVEAAREAYEVWSRMKQSERSALVMKISAAIRENIEELARLETLEHGITVNNVMGALGAAAGDLG